MSQTPKKTILFEKVTNPFKKNQRKSANPIDEWADFEEGEEEISQFEEDSAGEDNPLKMIMFGTGMPGAVDPAQKFDILINTYNLYTMHTNFYISQKILDIIAESEGVEALKVTSPYRAMIVFGKAFNDSDARKTVQKRISDYLFRQKEPEKALPSLLQTYMNKGVGLIPDQSGEQV